MIAFWVLLLSSECSLVLTVPVLCFLSLQDSFQARSARAMYAAVYIAMRLGYYISPTKSSIQPTQNMVHLGYGIDSRNSSFYITDKCRRKVATRRNELLDRGTADLHDIQSWVGKCNHLRLVFPASSLFTFECRQWMSSLADDKIAIPDAVRQEIEFWGFVDTHTEPIPFLKQQHVTVRLSTDASGYAWGASISLPSGPLEYRDYWSSNLFEHDICAKEGLAVLFGLQSIEDQLHGRRVDVFVDNQGLALAWQGLKSRSPELVGVLRTLFSFCVDLRVSLKLSWISTDANPADAPSRVVDRSDAALSDKLRRKIWGCYGPFSFDLMALPSNVFRSPSGRPLPFFSRFPLPSASGTDVFAQSAPEGRLYAFPPFCVIVPLIRLFMEWGGVEVVIVLPVRRSPAPFLHVLDPYVVDCTPLSSPGAHGALSLPSAGGYRPSGPSSFGLSAYLCRFPAHPRPSPSPPVSLRVLVVSDSMLRPLATVRWPSPIRALVHPYSGATLRQVIAHSLRLADASSDVVLFHAGVNDVSKCPAESFRRAFEASCEYAADALAAFFPGRRIVCSLLTVSRSPKMNALILQANNVLRSAAATAGWVVVSNDNVRVGDLKDQVHLNASGVARLTRNFVSALKSL